MSLNATKFDLQFCMYSFYRVTLVFSKEKTFDYFDVNYQGCVKDVAYNLSTISYVITFTSFQYVFNKQYSIKGISCKFCYMH